MSRVCCPRHTAAVCRPSHSLNYVPGPKVLSHYQGPKIPRRTDRSGAPPSARPAGRNTDAEPFAWCSCCPGPSLEWVAGPGHRPYRVGPSRSTRSPQPRMSAAYLAPLVHGASLVAGTEPTLGLGGFATQSLLLSPMLVLWYICPSLWCPCDPYLLAVSSVRSSRSLDLASVPTTRPCATLVKLLIFTDVTVR